MAIPKALLSTLGSWRGESLLHRSWLEGDEKVSRSESQLRIQSDARQTFLKIAYTWSLDGEAQEGEMLLCQADEEGAVEIGWVDSWHQSGGVMHLAGAASPEGVRTKGSFDAGGETWGWTIDFTVEDDRLIMAMDNVSPQGEADWAVRAEYRRA